jgi:MoxR-like ATPase
MNDAPEQLPPGDLQRAESLQADYAKAVDEIGKRIVGQRDVIHEVLLTLLVGGNSLLIGVPGLAKTLLIETLSRALDLSFARIQFTPDLMPSDITGTDLVQEDPQSGRRELVFHKGPVFANVVLADEINRTPPKTQAALLEAMQERKVSVQGETYVLPEPFFVFATQNPIELEGTYPLPEAQLDRFMFNIVLQYPPEDEELEIVKTTTTDQEPQVRPVIGGPELLAYQHLVRRVPLADPVTHYALALVRATRPNSSAAPEFINRWLAYGASVRAAQFLVLGGKARALTQGRTHVGFQDIRALARPVLRHRLLRNFHAESEQIGVEQIIDQLLETVASPIDSS